MYSKELAARDAGRLLTEAFQREMGIAASEQRTESYMLKSTMEHVNMLDPTGKRWTKSGWPRLLRKYVGQRRGSSGPLGSQGLMGPRD